MKLDGLKERVDAAVEIALGKKIVGTVLVVLKDGETIYRRAAGFIDREAHLPMREDAIFRHTSLTKPIVSVTALAMIERGLLSLDDNVTDHLPYFAPRFEGKLATVKVRHLLTHTAGLTYDADLLASVGATGGGSGPIIPLEENVRRIGTIPLRYAPGTQWEYSTAIDVLGCLIATINRSSLDEAVQRYVTGPLKMADTRFGVTDITRLAVPYGDGRPPDRMGDTHRVMNADGTPGPVYCPSRIFNPLAPQSGGSGMAGTADDFVVFLEAFRTGGGGILKPETVAAASQNQIGDVPALRRLPGERFGFISGLVSDPVARGTPQSKGTLQWGGIYGHNWFVDPVLGLTVVSMSNTGLEGCNGPYREEIRDAIYGAAA